MLPGTPGLWPSTAHDAVKWNSRFLPNVSQYFNSRCRGLQTFRGVTTKPLKWLQCVVRADDSPLGVSQSVSSALLGIVFIPLTANLQPVPFFLTVAQGLMKWTVFRNENQFHSDNRWVSRLGYGPIIWRLSPMTHWAEPRSQIFGR